MISPRYPFPSVVLAIFSITGAFVGFFLVFSHHQTPIPPSPPPEEMLPPPPASFTTPFGYGNITLERPTVIANSFLEDTINDTQLSENLPFPSPHNPVLIGTSPGFLPYSNNAFYFDTSGFRFLYLENITFTSENVVLRDNAYMMLTLACHPRYWDGIYEQPERVTYSFAKYESAICLGHQHSSDFGHWFLEILPAYCVIPRDVLLSSIIVLPEYHDYIEEHLGLLGVHPSQLVCGLQLTVFARHFYTAEFFVCADLVAFLITSFRNLVIAKFGLARFPPTRFMLFNRWNMSRAIGNWGELLGAVRERWPNITWEECPHLSGLQRTASLFDQIKLLFAVHGSIMANILFMQPDTSLVSLEMEQWLQSFLWLAAFTGKYVTLGRDASITWRGLTPNIVDVPYVVSMIANGLEQLKVI
jgi:hypothetical protein